MGNNAKSVSIIGGIDGPTSIFIAGQQVKPKLSQKIKQCIYKKKRARIEKKIVANPHTLDEMISYIADRYSIVEISQNTYSYTEEYNSLKESLIIRYQPKLLGDLMDIKRPKDITRESMQVFMEEAKRRTQKVAEISDEIFPLDFHIYEIKSDNGCVHIAIEKNWEELGISYSGSKKEMRKLKAIVNDIYLYYGVTKEDIEKKTLRFSVLVTHLSS